MRAKSPSGDSSCVRLGIVLRSAGIIGAPSWLIAPYDGRRIGIHTLRTQWVYMVDRSSRDERRDEGSPQEDGRVRVLAVIKGLGRGGAEALLHAQARYLDTAEFDFEVAHVLSRRDAMRTDFERLGIPVHRLGTKHDVPGIWLTRLQRLLALNAYDILHVHSPLTASAVRLLRFARSRNRRPVLIYTEHNRWAAYRLPTRLANALSYGCDDYRLAVSADVVTSLPVRFRSETEILTHGIDRQNVLQARNSRTRVRAMLGLDEQAVIIVTVANLRPEKGYRDLLRAAAIVMRKVPGVIFLSVGSGPEEEALKALHQQLDLRQQFRFLGFRSDAVDVMASSDVFCLASHHEGLPVAIMEATTLGLPIVATSVGGMAEVLENGLSAILVRPQDPTALADALVQVCCDPELRAGLRKNSCNVSQRFDAQSAVSRLAEIYRTAVKLRASDRGQERLPVPSR